MMRETPAKRGGGGGKYLRDSALGEQCGSVANFVKGTTAKVANLPQSLQSSHSPTANPRILEEEKQAESKNQITQESSSRAAQSGVAIHSPNTQNLESSIDYHDLPSKARDDSKNTLDSISIIIPCFNEKSTIADILQAVQSVQIPYHKEIVIVDDCSTDGTREILATLQPSQENCSLKILYHDKNQGKGAALRTGITKASGDIVLIQDADLEYDPNEYPKLLAPFEKGVADVVFGSRFVSGESHRVLYFWHRMGNGLLTLLSNMMTNLNLTDMETCYKVFKREIIQSITIEENRFGFEPEITAKIAKIKGIRIYEVGISYYGRTYEEGKKIGVKDGFRALWAIVKYRFKH